MAASKRPDSFQYVELDPITRRPLLDSSLNTTVLSDFILDVVSWHCKI